MAAVLVSTITGCGSRSDEVKTVIALLDENHARCGSAARDMYEIWSDHRDLTSGGEPRFPERFASTISTERARGQAGVELLAELLPGATARASADVGRQIGDLAVLQVALCRIVESPRGGPEVFRSAMDHLVDRFEEVRWRLEKRVPVSRSERAALLAPLRDRIRASALEKSYGS